MGTVMKLDISPLFCLANRGQRWQVGLLVFVCLHALLLHEYGPRTSSTGIIRELGRNIKKKSLDSSQTCGLQPAR